MKPTPQTSSTQWRSRHDSGVSRQHRNFPVTDHSFQSSTEQYGSVRALPRTANHVSALRKFRRLSSEFLSGETSRDYVKEIILFIVIAGVSAWPIFSMIRALARLVR